MVEEIMYFLPPFIAFALLAIGFAYEEMYSGLIGAILLFLYGVVILIDPLPVLSSLMNLVLGNVTWGFGAYIFIRGVMEDIDRSSKNGVRKLEW